MEIELTRVYFKGFKCSSWVIDLINEDKISTGEFLTKKDALKCIKDLQEEFNIKGFKRCNDIIN